MKRGSTLFLQIAIVFIGIVALAIMIWFPLTEGRAVNLDLFSIYSDPFIVYGYLVSIPFFVALYQAFKLLGYVGQNKVFSLNSMKALMTIKYCAIILSILIVMAALYIRIFHAKDDDPAGFIAIAILATFISAVIVTVAAVFERTLKNAVDIKSENDLTV
jgi:Flp pilus assembly pilin Flp